MPAYLRPFTDNLPLVAGLIAAAMLFRTTRREGATRRAAAAGATVRFTGLSIALLMAIHIVVVCIGRILSPVPPTGAGTMIMGVWYDFRWYSLVVTGFAMMLPALRCFTSARSVAHGDGAARNNVRNASLLLFALGLPLIPLQIFAVLVVLFAIVNGGALWLGAGTAEVVQVGAVVEGV